ncbi:PREDICTED: zinc transporter 9 [Wasmannia auropunctata]|uniref:zinc transporter 9 n=1 Tax=Wasmannia auropunctata TaxID=64793 RepID=UPI0005EEF5ED|nr:PREDICTED: zinc transporter 9 [Wasmannia auropunctata]XP_011707615.1 PREDICTED: zinc transporter 9 [Wasmannia auropunctata]
MLHRPHNLVNFIRNVTCRYRADQLCIFQIGLVRRHASILVVPKYGTRHKVHTFSNSQKVFANRKVGRHGEYRWTYATRFSSNDAKSNKDKSDAKLVEEVQQRIIELNEEKLGKLKERVLDIEPVISEKEERKGQAGKREKLIEKSVESKEPSKDDVVSKKAKKQVRVDRSTSSLERNFITPVRAMADFLLKPSDLETLPKTKRRSPYEFEPPITVYWRKDVEAKALEVWGSREALLKELLKKEVERKIYQQNVFTVKRRLRDYRREIGSKTEIIQKEGLFGRSGKVVLTAIAINASNFVCKLIAWLYTGSHSMFSECVHSAADTFNQLILAYGIHKSVQHPNPDHPYGYTNMKYVSSLISGVGIFCVGTGLSIYHGIHGLLFPAPLDSLFWAYFVLGGSLLSEGATLMIALHSIKKSAEEKKESLKQFVLDGQDPSVNVVLMEDFAAVIGVIVAAGCMGLTSYLENPMFDAIGSLLVGGLLGGVASFIIYSNVAALIGRSISQENLDKINAELEADIMVRAIHDVKGIDMGNNLVRYKAELDFDGRELTRSYLDKHDLIAMLEEVKSMQNIDELEAFLLKHGENIVDMLGGEIDRIELKLKKNHPEIRHCDLEIL